MELATDFKEFLSKVRPTKSQKQSLKEHHERLRDRLNKDEDLKDILVSDFLQGSYRRHTALRPKDKDRSDVDIIVVTNLDESDYSPQEAMDLFKPFMDKHYKGKWKFQGRSIGIEMSTVDMDLVITSAPSMAEPILLSESVRTLFDVDEEDDWDKLLGWRFNANWVEHPAIFNPAKQRNLENQPEWKAEPLRIPDRDRDEWQDTDPLTQIMWTRDKNKKCEKFFVNVVTALKWWRLEKEIDVKPKGFPLERLIAEVCPDGIGSVAEGITRSLEGIRDQHNPLIQGKPVLPDYGLENNDVFSRISFSDYSEFYDYVAGAAEQARAALDEKDREKSGNLWRELLGTRFPKPPEKKSGGSRGFTDPSGPSILPSGRFA